jgi:hypothetical protein
VFSSCAASATPARIGAPQPAGANVSVTCSHPTSYNVEQLAIEPSTETVELTDPVTGTGRRTAFPPLEPAQSADTVLVTITY